jgi:hypothetical protein
LCFCSGCSWHFCQTLQRGSLFVCLFDCCSQNGGLLTCQIKLLESWETQQKDCETCVLYTCTWKLCRLIIYRSFLLIFESELKSLMMKHAGVVWKNDQIDGSALHVIGVALGAVSEGRGCESLEGCWPSAAASWI